jgi:uncharacterized protein YcaQ
VATSQLSLSEARRIALAAQGFDRPRPKGPVSLAQVRRVIEQLGLVQIDYVNVLAPAHYLVLFSRLGAYPRSRLDESVYRRRAFTEQWAHEASIVPMDAWPLLHHRREIHRVRPWGFERFLEQHPAYVERVLDEVRARGPLTADDVPEVEGAPTCIPGAWHASVARAVLEAHFGRGLLAVAERRPNFARVYDLAERIVPAVYHEQRPDRADAQRELLRRAARAHGIATAADLADYYRMQVREVRPRLAELVAKGDIREVRVEAWREPAYLHAEARLPRRVEGAALLCPFDPVVWYRPRAARLFGFDYRVEIFVPRPQRRWGYYVLPFLLDDRFVARVDLRADRAGRRLIVHAAYGEAETRPTKVAAALAAELRKLAGWLGLDSVAVEPLGDLAKPLRKAVES